MKIIELNKRTDLDQNQKLNNKNLQFDLLISELRKQEIPDDVITVINKYIGQVNSIIGSSKELKKQIGKSQTEILKLIEKDLKLVVKNHYRNTWLAIGIALGVAIGSALGAGTGNMSLFGLGLPLGMAMGIAYGTTLDKKAKADGKQLDLEIH